MTTEDVLKKKHFIIEFYINYLVNKYLILIELSAAAAFTKKLLTPFNIQHARAFTHLSAWVKGALYRIL